MDFNAKFLPDIMEDAKDKFGTYEKSKFVSPDKPREKIVEYHSPACNHDGSNREDRQAHKY